MRPVTSWLPWLPFLPVLLLAPRAHAQSEATTDVTPDERPAPLAFADFSWVPGNAGASEKPLSFGPFTGEFRLDTAYHYSFNRPQDDTLSGSSEVFRHGEVQVTQLGIGGDFLYKNVMGRLMTQFGMYSQTTPRNDASPARGQWNLDDAYRYVSEAYGGYHFDALRGINLQAGIFMSYIGLWSYYNADNWTYQPSYVSSNTPWFFNGVRAQIYVSDTLKIEPWLINGWQSYGRFNDGYGVGGQILWRPTGWLSVVGNQYYGSDTLGNPDRKRVHTDDSVMVKYLDTPGGFVTKAAASLTLDAGCEFGGGVDCGSQYFLGFMAYHRAWFLQDRLALTVGGGAITNPGRYLVLLPPINGTTAASGTPYFTANPGDRYRAWDFQVAADVIPQPFITFRVEFNHRAANVPYFSGRGGVTPPGGNQGAPGSLVDGWSPDLVKTESRLTGALMVKI
ncbi:outer membrane beta-barrel protein [Corallococcus carmarthensis]|uniref:outer membrane beta-barrel protein n=1 Tax=Corallococcus carmarthensis TaxID=2316728 RepID=UPI00148D4A6F|nr:outer membrane beta-barrel protein [Corallococcus carmarthensis]NOK22806.1 outer membrane beta-barrel protein [Corallococcus carmarthensis]